MRTSTSKIRRLEENLQELLESHRKGKSLDHFARYADDPVAFAVEELGVTPYQKQAEILESVLDNPSTAVHGANATGKDYVAAIAALWGVFCRGYLVLYSSAAQRQVEDVFFRYLRELFRAAPTLPGDLYSTKLKIEGRDDLGIRGFVSTSASRMTGYHGARVFGILSEAQEIPDFGFEAIYSCATGEEDRLLALGNPLFATGTFRDICRSESGWDVIRISVTDHPNLQEGERTIPGGPSRKFVERLRDTYGRDSNIYRSRVLGEFPSSDEDGLIRREWIDAAQFKWEEDAFYEDRKTAEPILGVDVAWKGPDRSVCCVRRGSHIDRFVVWAGLDTHESASKVLEVAKEEGLRKAFPQYGIKRHGRIVTDSVGYGAGLGDALNAKGWKISEFNGGKSPELTADAERFLNLRAHAYWQLRRALEQEELALPPDSDLVEELMAIRWGLSPNGKIQLEAKDDIRGRIGRSPDLADALVMAWWGKTAPQWTSQPFRVV